MKPVKVKSGYFIKYGLSILGRYVHTVDYGSTGDLGGQCCERTPVKFKSLASAQRYINNNGPREFDEGFL